MPVAVPKNTDFELLGLGPDAGEDEIRVAYKKLALKWHPDRHTDDKEEAQQKFIEISDAYAALLDQCRHKRRAKPAPTKAERHFPWSSSSPSASSSSSAASAESSNGDRTSTGSKMESRANMARDEKEGHTEEKTHREETRSRSTSNRSRTSGETPHREPENAQPRREHDDESGDRGRDRHEHSHKSKHNEHHARDRQDHGHHRDHERHERDRRSGDHHKHPSPSRKHSADQSDDEDGAAPKSAHSLPKRAKLGEDDYDFINLSAPLAPLHPAAAAPDWLFPLALPLEDLYAGATHRYRITRALRSGRTEAVSLTLHVAPGWRAGTRVRVPGAGNERRGGGFQDIVFVVAEAPHARFVRAGADLVLPVQVPWREGGAEEEVYVQGLGGEGYALPIPRALGEGADGTRVVGAGMPVRKDGRVVGKGDLVIKWEFVFPEPDVPSRWHGLKKWKF